jgi:hypothetical protein
MQIVPTRRDQTHLFLGLFFQCSFSLSNSEGHFGRVISFDRPSSHLSRGITSPSSSFFLHLSSRQEMVMTFRPWRRGLYAFFLDFQEGYETFHPPTLGLCDHFNPLKRELLCLVNRHPLAGYLVHSWSEWYGLILSAIVLSFFFFSWVLDQQFFWRGRTLWNFLWTQLEHTLSTFLWLWLVFIDAASLEDMHGPGYWSWKVSRHVDDYRA